MTKRIVALPLVTLLILALGGTSVYSNSLSKGTKIAIAVGVAVAIVAIIVVVKADKGPSGPIAIF